jgi:hypothetical protein
MALQLSSVSTITTTATGLGNLLLVSPQNTIGYQPQNAAIAPGNKAPDSQPPAILFHYEGEQTATIESDITDHYVEDNTAVQDQISLKPEIITTHGFIGELNDVVPTILQPLYVLANKLAVISAYTPALSVTALEAYNEAFLLYQTAANVGSSAISTYNSLSGGGGENVIDSNGTDDTFSASTGQVANSQNKQQTYFQQFYGYWRARTLFTVQTPWAVFENMAIMRLRAIQDAETNMITDFEITFKMIRSASTISSLSGLYAGRFQQQAADPTDVGIQTTVSGPSVSDGITSMQAAG